MASVDVNVKENTATVEAITIKIDAIAYIRSVDSGNDCEITLINGDTMVVDNTFAAIKALL